VLGNDLQLVSRGRFQLGLGSQVQQHIERRYAMTWSHPAARMEELVAAIRAIWHSWATGDRLAFRGQFYRHTLMTDFFDPGPNPPGHPADPAGRRRRADDRGGRTDGRRAALPQLHDAGVPARAHRARAARRPG